MASKLRSLVRTSLVFTKPNEEVYKHTIDFGKMIPVEKVIYEDESKEYFDIHLVNGDIIKNVKSQHFEFIGIVNFEIAPKFEEDSIVFDLEKENE